MTSPRSQRWRERRASYRPDAEEIDPSQYGVDVITRTRAAAFVRAHHYSGSHVASRLDVGLFRRRPGVGATGTDLVGVASLSVGVQPRAITRWTGQPPSHGIELGRFVLLDDVEGNGETWFLSRVFRLLRQQLPEVRSVLAYSDPVPRTAADGREVKPGHMGGIYRCSSARLVGTSSARQLWIDAHGRAVSLRTLSKVRLDERGRDAAVETLLSLGAPPRLAGESGASWVKRIQSSGLLRPLRHPGNLAFSWGLDKRARLALPLPTPPETGGGSTRRWSA